ncbi:sigma-70 family RNA polymerase sigma factor [Alloalcanivorax sp. C16-1]|uniref:sigma-70 family RNA polymerase sigma factor n=1 Tax=Alloalcanivorax sp. C16-1 TaxID=3390051 RepID=UPI0039707E68
MHADDLFQRHARELNGYLCRRLNSPEQAADLCHEVYLRLRRLDPQPAEALTNPRAFLFRIARNLLIDHLRQQRSRPVTVPLGDPHLDLESSAPTPESAASSAQAVDGLRTALTDLPDHVRQALLWNRLDGVSQREIGERLGVSERMAGKYIARALAHCRALVAALVVIVVVAAALPWSLWTADARTGAGERRTLTLADGSRVILNGRSAINIDITDQRRRVEVVRGEALFQVAKDPDHPFLVRAGDARVRVTGTRFEVRRRDGTVRLTVAEGSVRAGDGHRHRSLRAGQQVHWRRGRLGEVETVDAAATLAWARGRLVFRDRPLGELLAELRPYHPDRLVLLNNELADRRVSGTFAADQPEAVLSALTQTLPVRALRLPGMVLLY